VPSAIKGRHSNGGRRVKGVGNDASSMEDYWSRAGRDVDRLRTAIAQETSRITSVTLLSAALPSSARRNHAGMTRLEISGCREFRSRTVRVESDAACVSASLDARPEPHGRGECARIGDRGKIQALKIVRRCSRSMPVSADGGRLHRALGAPASERRNPRPCSTENQSPR